MKSILISLFWIALLNRSVYSFQCNYTLVESIPEGLNLTDGDVYKAPSTHTSWLDLINSAQHNISIAQFYFSLRCLDVLNDTIESCGPGKLLLLFSNSVSWFQLIKLVIITLINLTKIDSGEQVLKAFESAAKRGVQVNIVVNGNSSNMNEDLVILQRAGANIKFLNFDQLIGAGILHTKFIIVDDSRFYLGSANMDWRSLTQVKEVGILLNSTCPVLGNDLRKIFSVYWYLSDQNAIPARLPTEFDTKINLQNPLTIKLNNVNSKVFLTSSPYKMNTPGRTNDIDAILHIIKSAKRFIKFSVMDYSPTFLYANDKYWPVIDNALRYFFFFFTIIICLLLTHLSFLSVFR